MVIAKFKNSKNGRREKLKDLPDGNYRLNTINTIPLFSDDIGPTDAYLWFKNCIQKDTDALTVKKPEKAGEIFRNYIDKKRNETREDIERSLDLDEEDNPDGDIRTDELLIDDFSAADLCEALGCVQILNEEKGLGIKVNIPEEEKKLVSVGRFLVDMNRRYTVENGYSDDKRLEMLRDRFLEFDKNGNFTDFYFYKFVSPSFNLAMRNVAFSAYQNKEMTKEQYDITFEKIDAFAKTLENRHAAKKNIVPEAYRSADAE